jgi:hypothetical protein
MDPVLDPLIRKPSRAGNRTPDLWICNLKPSPLDHRDGPIKIYIKYYFFSIETHKILFLNVNQPAHFWAPSSSTGELLAVPTYMTILTNM